MNPRNIDLNWCTACHDCRAHAVMSQEEAMQQIELLTDLIELQPGVSLRDLHPEMSTKELAERGLKICEILNKL